MCLADRKSCRVYGRRPPFQTVAQQEVFFLNFEIRVGGLAGLIPRRYMHKITLVMSICTDT